MAKATATATTEQQQPVTSPLSFDFAEFDTPEGEQADAIVYPKAIILNEAEPRHGIFIGEAELRMAAWSGPKPDHKHSFRKGEKEVGLLIQKPRMLIVNVSDRIVQAVPKKDPATKKLIPIVHPLSGEELAQNTLLCSYETEEGKTIYSKLKEQGIGRLRTFYLFYLVGDDNALLHKIPFVMSIHGNAAVSFGRSYAQFKMALYAAYAQVVGKGFKAQSQKFASLAVFVPTLVSTMEGEVEKSPVCSVESFEEPDGSSPEALAKHYLGQYREEIQGLYESSKNSFVAGFVEREKEFMPALEGAVTPRQTAPAIEENDGTGEDAIPVMATVVNADEAPDF